MSSLEILLTDERFKIAPSWPLRKPGIEGFAGASVLWIIESFVGILGREYG